MSQHSSIRERTLADIASGVVAAAGTLMEADVIKAKFDLLERMPAVRRKVRRAS